MAASSGSEYFEIDMEGKMFQRQGPWGMDAPEVREDEPELMWAAVERLPSVRRQNFAIVRRGSRSSSSHTQSLPFEVVDVRRLDRAARERVLNKAFATTNQDNYNLLSGIKSRFDRYTTRPLSLLQVPHHRSGVGGFTRFTPESTLFRLSEIPV